VRQPLQRDCTRACLAQRVFFTRRARISRALAGRGSRRIGARLAVWSIEAGAALGLPAIMTAPAERRAISRGRTDRAHSGHMTNLNPVTQGALARAWAMISKPFRLQIQLRQDTQRAALPKSKLPHRLRPRYDSGVGATDLTANARRPMMDAPSWIRPRIRRRDAMYRRSTLRVESSFASPQTCNTTWKVVRQ
jgi:hypothetical protein